MIDPADAYYFSRDFPDEQPHPDSCDCTDCETGRALDDDADNYAGNLED